MEIRQERRARTGRGIKGVRIGLRTFAGLVLATALLLGCDDGPADPRVPTVGGGADQVPVILVPGAEASVLVTAEGGEAVWSGDPRHLLNPSAFERVALSLDPALSQDPPEPLVAADIIRSVMGKDYYGGMIESLERRVGSPCVLPEVAGPESRCVLFPWDWRLELRAAAADLERLIDRLRVARGAPDLRVDLIAHSAGGLVVRYFIRFGGRDLLDQVPERVRVDFSGAPKVRRAVLIGVPNDGTLFGLRLMMRGHQVGLVDLRPEHIAVMPGAYQVLPSPGRDWLIDLRGHPLRRDLYDPATWRALRQSIFDPEVARRLREGPGGERRLADLEVRFARALERGRRIHLALSRPAANPFAYEVFAGDCQPTPARYLEEQLEGRAHLRFFPHEIARPSEAIDYERLMYGPGDGWVTRGSALGSEAGTAPFAVRNAVFDCTEHAELAAVHTVRHNLLGLLALADAEPIGGLRGDRLLAPAARR